MSELLEAFQTAVRLIVTLDSELAEIVALSLRVSLSALVIATLLALPIGATVGILRFPGRRLAIILLNSLLALPAVVVGLRGVVHQNRLALLDRQARQDVVVMRLPPTPRTAQASVGSH